MAALQYWVIVPAAGAGQRMGATIPKQYLPLENSTVIEISLRHFLNNPKISGVVVALHQDDKCWNELTITKDDRIHTVIGGKTRTESVFNAVSCLENTSAEDQDFVIVHDAARPCLRNTDLELLMQQLENDDVGGILAAPVSDTLKMADKLTESISTVVKTLDRASIWRALTPQMFRLGILNRALKYCMKLNIEVTDEASAVEQLGLQVKLIKGQSDNIKITHAEDLELAAGILKKIKQ